MFPAFKGQGGRSRQKTYQYQTGDSPATLAQQFQTTPQELINANPGGYPFTNGQTINLPLAFKGQGGGAQPFSPPRPNIPAGFSNPHPSIQPSSFNNPHPYRAPVIKPTVGEGRGDPAMRALAQSITQTSSAIDMFASNLMASGVPDFNLLPPDMNLMQVKTLQLTPDVLAELGYVQDPNTKKWVQTNQQQTAGGQPNQPSAEFMNTGFMQYNTANNVAFENQMRWDPKKKKFRTIGQIQNDYGYLPNATGGKNKKKKKSGGGSQPAQPATQQERPTGSTESSVNFGAGTG